MPRHDGLGRPVPNVCLKVPTGGGKTLLACAALERIQIEYFKQQTGLVLWIVPSEAIYAQTWKRFANREDPYRQMLERASGGRVKLLEKEDAFSRQDVEQHLCVMLLMLQAGAVKRDSKERRRMFQDSGRYAGFFPEVDDLPANKDLLQRVPNLDVAGTDLRRRGVTEQRLIANRLFLVKAMRDDLQRQVNEAGEREFRALLERGELSFRLVASGDEQLNWELAETLELDVTEEDREFVQRDGRPLERSLCEKVYQKQLNGLEREVAWYLDGGRAVRWWHRIAAQQDWHLQGWQRNKVYPDFLACVQELGKGRIRFAVLETKGLHLKGSEDTAYKERLFELLEKVFETGLPAGELQLAVGPRELRFELLLENNWRERIRRPLASLDG